MQRFIITIFNEKIMTEKLLARRGKIEIYATIGDITQIQTPAILTAINSGGLWFGGVDRAIQKIAGEHYHAQAAAQMPLKNLQTIIAKGNVIKHKGKFQDVIFVVDDLQSNLDKVVYAGLESAHYGKYNKILMPAMRMGVMAGVRETPKEAIHNIGRGIDSFASKYGQKTQLNNITWVVYNDPKTMGLLEMAFGS